MPKSRRAYKSAKRSKELDRLRKREEKRRRRLAAKTGVSEGEDGAAVESGDQEGSAGAGDEKPDDDIIPRD
jgi:hypothetical protein